MKRFSTMMITLAILASVTGEAMGQFTTDWQKSVASANLPLWFGTDTERGMAYGLVNSNERLYVVTRKTSPTKLFVLNAATGDSVTAVSVTGVTGGTYTLNDVEVSDDGIIIAANMTTNASTSAFKVYRWDTESSEPVVIVNTTVSEAVRLGDKITVTGSISDNSAKIWAASATSGATTSKVYVWSMTDGAFNASPTVITLSDNVTGGTASVHPRADGSFYLNYNGVSIKRYTSTGTLVGAVSTGIIASGTNAVRMISTTGGFDYVATFAYGSGNHLARIAKTPSTPSVSAGLLTNTTLFASTVTNGSATNGNGVGDLDYRINSNGTITIFVLGTNNGISSSTSSAQLSELTYSATLTGSSGYRTLASPVANTALSSVFGSIWTQGFTGADAANGGSNVYFHPNGSNNFVSATDISNTISAGHGVLVGVFADDDYGTEGVQGGFPKTLSVTGIANSGDVAVSPSHSSGDEYFLAGNPYNSTVDWDLVTKGADVYNIAWVLGSDGEFDSWNGTAGDLTDGLIAPFQGFFYAYSGAGSTVTFTEASKSSGGTFRGKEESPLVARIALSRDGRENATWLQFAGDGTFGRDRFDAPKMASFASDVMQVSTKEIGSGAAMDIHYLPLIGEALELPLGITATRGGDFTLSLGSSTLPAGWLVSVRDAVTGTTTELGADRTLAFRSDTPLSATEPRFTLIVEPSSSTSVDRGPETVGRMELEQNYPNPFNPSTQIHFTLDAGRQTRLAVYDLLGREVAVLVNGSMPAGAQSVTFDASTLASGVYLYKLEAGGQVLTRRMTLVK